MKENRHYYEEVEEQEESIWYGEEGREVIESVFSKYESILYQIRQFDEFLTIIDMDRNKLIERREKEDRFELGKAILPEPYEDEHGFVKFKPARRRKAFETLRDRVAKDLALNIREFKRELNHFKSLINDLARIKGRTVLTENNRSIIKDDIDEFKKVVDDARRNLTTLDDMSKQYYALVRPQEVRRRIREDVTSFLIEYTFEKVSEWDIALSKDLIGYVLNVFDGYGFTFGRMKGFREYDEFTDLIDTTEEVRKAMDMGERDKFRSSMREANSKMMDIKKILEKEMGGKDDRWNS